MAFCGQGAAFHCQQHLPYGKIILSHFRPPQPTGAIRAVRSGFTKRKDKENYEMNNKVLQNYAQLASRTGLRFEAQSGAIFGLYNGYKVLVYPENENYPYILTASVSANRPGSPLSKAEGKAFSKEHKPINSMRQDGYRVKITLGQMANQEKLAANLTESLNAFTSFLHANGFQNCCETCGSTNPTEACVAGGSCMQLCYNCFVNLQQNQAVNSSEKQKKKENIVGGIVGALIGSLLGAACIVLLGQLGYVAALSGVIMAVCTMKGYDLLGGKLSTIGVIICAVIMLVMTYTGNRLDWAISVAQGFEVDIATAFRSVPLLIEEEIIDAASYWANLVMVYVFVLIGAIPTVVNTMKNQKKESIFYRLGV